MDVENYLDEMGVEYYQTEKRFMVCCPFHDDANPSCGIWSDSGYFKCFACGEEGNFAEFISEVLEIPIWEARRKIKGQDDISDLEDSILKQLKRVESELKYFKWTSFCSTYSPILPETRVWEYLEDRGLSNESISRFSVRWGGDTGKFRYRAIFPITTLKGKLLSYSGRAVKAGMIPPWRNNRSPHRTLFGISELLRTVAKPKVPFLIIVEGIVDAVYLQQCGIPAVSNMGVSPMNMDKIRLLRQSTKNVVLSYDGDDAGYKAMHGNGEKRGELHRLSMYMTTSVVDLPDGSDPNDLSEKEVDEIYGKWKLTKGER
jgi:DNA primase